jgi:hypothetical protein
MAHRTPDYEIKAETGGLRERERESRFRSKRLLK